MSSEIVKSFIIPVAWQAARAAFQSQIKIGYVERANQEWLHNANHLKPFADELSALYKPLSMSQNCLVPFVTQF